MTELGSSNHLCWKGLPLYFEWSDSENRDAISRTIINFENITGKQRPDKVDFSQYKRMKP